MTKVESGDSSIFPARPVLAEPSAGENGTVPIFTDVPGIPCEGEAPVFAEPWQAQAFAMALALQQRGLFTWSEWAETLGDEIRKARAAGDPDDGSTYYLHWLTTLERLITVKSIADAETLHRYVHAWDHAAGRTPHGQPIELRPEDFHS